MVQPGVQEGEATRVRVHNGAVGAPVSRYQCSKDLSRQSANWAGASSVGILLALKGAWGVPGWALTLAQCLDP